MVGLHSLEPLFAPSLHLIERFPIPLSFQLSLSAGSADWKETRKFKSNLLEDKIHGLTISSSTLAKSAVPIKKKTDTNSWTLVIAYSIYQLSYISELSRL